MRQLISESIHFARQFSQNLATIGSIVPTSGWAGREMASEVARRRSPRRVLEVGAGTGAISAEIAPLLTPEDELFLCEINPEFVTYLQNRVAQDPCFQHIRKCIHIHAGSVLDLPAEPTFDLIVSALPFNSLPIELVQEVLNLYRVLLHPGGTLTYIEYIGGRTFKNKFQPSEAGDAVYALTQKLLQDHRFRRGVVFRNVPPAWVHHLRFDEVDSAESHNLQPTDRDKLHLGPLPVDREAIPWVVGLLSASALFKRRSLALLALPVALFFRDPSRTTPPDPSLIYAAGDGEVLSIEYVQEASLGDTEWVRIAVFLSLFDVHVNRAPVAGKVLEVWTQKGRFVAANHRDAVHNQSVYTRLETTNGPCIVAQRVGAVARRIVNRAAPQTLLAQGEKYGLMRFGSRIDIYVPAGTVEPLVIVGQPVRGGETPLARYKNDI